MGSSSCTKYGAKFATVSSFLRGAGSTPPLWVVLACAAAPFAVRRLRSEFTRSPDAASRKAWGDGLACA